MERGFKISSPSPADFKLAPFLGLAQLPLGFDLGSMKEETFAGNRVRFLAARGSPCGLPTAILCFFVRKTNRLFAAERDMDVNSRRPYSKEWDST